MSHKTEQTVAVKQVQPERLQPATIRKLWTIFIILLAATVIAQFWVHPHGYFRFDDAFWFYPVYGLIASIALVLFSRLVGTFLKRPEDYWNTRREKEEPID